VYDPVERSSKTFNRRTALRSTILDIARVAGVSRTTVSNVMNGNAKCTPETQERVLRAAADLDYRPNFAARSLVNRRSNMVGLVLPSYAAGHFLTKSPFYSLTVDAINATLRDSSDFDLLINCVNPDADPAEVVVWALQRNLAGLIFVGDVGAQDLGALEGSGIPLAFIDNYAQPRPRGIFIETDNQAGAALAVDRLVARGCRRIACCSSHTEVSSVNQARYQGYLRALEASGQAPLLLEGPGILFEDGVALAPTLVDRGVDGAFAVGDTLALGLLKGLASLGVRVPADIAVAGFDNLDAASQSLPELTTVDQSIYQKGRLAVERLTEAIRAGAGPVSQTVATPVRLVVRDSA